MYCNMIIKLNYYKTHWINYQWMILYEFSIDFEKLWELSDTDILNSLIGTRIINKNISHPEIDKDKIDLLVDNINRPYDFTKLFAKDFRFYPDYNSYNRIIQDFSQEDDWGDNDEDDFNMLVSISGNTIRERTSFYNGFWFLNKDKIINRSDIVEDNHMIYLYFLTIIDIDRQNKIIRSIDFGYD